MKIQTCILGGICQEDVLHTCLQLLTSKGFHSCTSMQAQQLVGREMKCMEMHVAVFERWTHMHSRVSHFLLTAFHTLAGDIS